MVENPSSNIVLVGSSAQGPNDGLEMAQSVKVYLVNIFEINPTRITIEGRNKPVLAAVQKGGTIDIVMLREGDRRVTIESNSPALLMEFQSGPNAPLKPIEIVSVQDAPIDSYFSVNLVGAQKAFSSWKLELTDASGAVQNYGPYSQETVAIPGKTILGNKPEGTYKVRMIGTTKNGKTVIKDATTHIVLWKSAVTETGTRFSVLYDFNNSKANGMYQKYLTNVVTPKIPTNATVIIHGHTDIIGDDSYNQRLSLARANDVKNIMQNALAKVGRNDVKFDIYGLGEDEKTAPFENKYAEERFYNRTVIIDIIPQK